VTTTAAAVLDFWFGAPPLTRRVEWFRKSDEFDSQVRLQFGATVEAALAGNLQDSWHPSVEGRLAQVLLLDQFTRNIFRGTARAFAGDPQALRLSLALLDEQADRGLPPLQRWFIYMPLEHAEDLALQDRSVELFAAVAQEDPTMADVLDYAERHRDVVRLFGRFPHRNALLGRQSSAEEVAFLKQPGAGF
jgi:uncharacterized protein (DUF924 family)